jgi:CubicO group peptidase (beta-lactamase class C family)
MRKHVMVVIVLLACFLLVSSRGMAEAPPLYEVPPTLDDGWRTAPPEEVGLDRTRIEAVLREIHGAGHDHLHSVLLVKDGKLVLEEYLNGYYRQRPHDVASVTKSVTSILIGIAIEQGVITGADQPLAELLPEYADLLQADPAKAGLKLWHILTMTSGFEWDEETYPYGDPRNDCTQMQQVADPVRFVLERPIVHEPGTHFQYAGANSMLLSAILKRQTGVQAHQFAKTNLFEPLGISGVRWGLYANALTDTDGGLSLRPRDMAKIGLLYLDGGRWNGQQVVPSSWVEASTRARVPADAGADYGYQWWRTGIPVALRRADTYFASGFGGQAIHVFPELDMVVVFTNDLTPGSGNAMQNVALMSEYVLPAALGADWSMALPWAWPALVGLSLLGLLWDLARSRPRPRAAWLSWAWIVFVFGPLGYVVYRLAVRGAGGARATWLRALASSLYCAGGNAAGFCLLFALVALLQPQVDLLLPALVFPLLVGWLAFRAPAFAHQAGQGYGRALRRTLLAEVSTALPVLAGMLPAIILLQVRWFPAGNLEPAHPLFWLMISLAAMAGALLAYPINYWLARRGFATWPVAPGEEDGARPGTPSLRSAWWAPLAGIVVLVAALGLALTALS